MSKSILKRWENGQYSNQRTWVHVKNLVFSYTWYPKYPMILKINRVRIGYWKIFRVRVGYRVPVGPWSEGGGEERQRSGVVSPNFFWWIMQRTHNLTYTYNIKDSRCCWGNLVIYLQSADGKLVSFIALFMSSFVCFIAVVFLMCLVSFASLHFYMFSQASLPFLPLYFIFIVFNFWLFILVLNVFDQTLFWLLSLFLMKNLETRLESLNKLLTKVRFIALHTQHILQGILSFLVF